MTDYGPLPEIALVLVYGDRELVDVQAFSNGLLASIWVEREQNRREKRGEANRWRYETFSRVQIDEAIAVLMAEVL